MGDPLIDSVIGHYHVLSRLGGGAMGVVYKARDTKLGRLVALKFLPPEWTHDDDAKQRFVREAQAASATDHANICTVHDIQTTDDGRLFIVMAFYDGQTLKQRLAQGPVGLQEALDIATQIADGLARAHAAGVVHRDIKPGNVIVTEDAVKIVDFGLATFAGSVQLTQAGSPMGTVAYMAPEQLRGHDATAVSDVWAVGVILYEMLAGHPPFQGAYAEAISYAIRHETPPPLRATRPEITEELEQLVFRALHKDAAVRFASGRELARALRQARGFTVPLDLLTAPVDAPRRTGLPAPRRRLLRRVATGLSVLLLATAGAAWYLTRPIPRTFIAVAPVVNSTGDSTLDPYRLGLTLALTRELAESSEVRVPSYLQLLPPLRRFLLTNADVSSPEAVRAIQAASGAGIIAVPALLYERGAWKARADLQDAHGTAVGRVETAPVESSLTKEAAATLVGALANKIEERFRHRRWRLTSAAAPAERLGSLEAARTFEQGLNAYEAGEYASAREAFARAVREDPRHPLLAAWQSRVAQVTGDRDGAAEAADRAEARVQSTSRGETLFVQAVVAEARRQDENAARLYQAYADLFPDDPAALAELAGYQDRSGRTAEAIASYRRALSLDAQQPGPSLQLCRLYNSTRMNDAAQARAFGERARTRYAAIGSRLGEAQAMLCLSDILRVGTPDERAEARTLAANALGIFEALGLEYGIGRAQQYVAAAAQAQGDLNATAAALEKALASAEAVGNTSLEGTVYTNLGVTHNALGNRAKAIEYYTKSYELAERRGDERRAAYSRANAGALLLEYGARSDDGLRFVEGALGVVRRLGDKNFEVFCLQLVAAHDRFRGRYEEARRGLAQAMAIAREKNFVDAIPSLLLDDGRVLMQMGRYVEARDTFVKGLDSAGATRTPELFVELGRVRALLGDLDGGREALEKAQRTAAATSSDVAPRLATAWGELAYAGGRLKDARTSFETSSRMWVDDLPDAASVEARAYVGLIDGLEGAGTARDAVAASLQQAVRMKRPDLETLCRVFLARLDLRANRAAQAATTLSNVHADTLGPELRAQVLFWRAEAQAALGAGGQQERREATRLLDEAEQAVPEALRQRYRSRPDLQVLATLRK